MALKTSQIADRYKDLLRFERDDFTPELNVVRLREVKWLLLQALSPRQKIAYDMLLSAECITSRELADHLGTSIAAASNVLRALSRYELVTESFLCMHPEIMAERRDLWGYNGYIWMLGGMDVESLP